MNRQTLVARVTEILLLLLFAIPALSPLFHNTPLASADGLLHLYRLVELDAVWHNGIFYSRWLPDLAYGYGMPLFNYYAPLVYYLTTPLHLIGIPFTLALNLSLCVSMFLGAVGMFYFTRALVSRLITEHNRIFPAALLAAIAYTYSPYLLFNALYRANLAEQWALAFAPFALWRFFVLIEQRSAWNWAWAVLFFAAVMLSHNVTSFLFAPLLLFFTLACVLAKPERPRQLATYLIPLSALLLSLSLSAFFWLPALLERDFVQIARVIVTPDFDYRFNFVSPFELVAFLPRADTGRMNPIFPSTLGLVQGFLPVAGLYVLTRRFRSRRALPFFALVLAALGFIFLMLAISQPIWDSISLLSFVQLPMRLRGLVALCIAPLIGISILILPDRRVMICVLIAVFLLVLTALSLLYPRRDGATPHNPTITDMFAYEQSSGAFGTTSFGEYLPVWVQNPPDKTPFADAYARNQIPDRLVIPEGVTTCGVEISSSAQTICVTSSGSWRAVFQTFFFPGWTATLNGRPLEVTATPRTGLITFDVPESGTLRIAYTGTLVENWSNWLSLAALLILVFVPAYSVFNSIRHPIFKPQRPTAQPAPAFLSRFSSPFAGFAVLSLLLIAFKFLYVDRSDNMFVTTFNGIHVNGVGVERQAWFGDELYLLGYDYNGRGIGLEGPHLGADRGETETITIYWRALPGMHRNLSTYVHLTDGNGKIIAQQDSLHPGNIPTTRWTPNLYAQDIHRIQIPADLAPGVYEMTIGVYDPLTNERLGTTEHSSEILLPSIIVR